MINLKSWLKDTLYLSSVTGIDYATGKATYGVPIEIRGRVETEIKVVQGVDGEEHISNDNVVTNVEIKVTDRLWLPGKDQTQVAQSSKILAIGSASNKRGAVQMWTVYV